MRGRPGRPAHPAKAASGQWAESLKPRPPRRHALPLFTSEWTVGGVIEAPPPPLCRHALPLFTSLLNTVCAYDPVGYGIPYNHLLFSDYREPLVEEAAQVLIVTLDHDSATSASPTVDGTTTGTAVDDADVSTGERGLPPCQAMRGGGHLLQQPGRGYPVDTSWGCVGSERAWGKGGGGAQQVPSPRFHPPQPPGPENLFVNYLSRIHREEVS